MISQTTWSGVGRMADSACADMFLVHAGKLRVAAEEAVDWLRAEWESWSVSVASPKDALVKILLMFESRKGWARATTRFRRTQENVLERRVRLEAQTV
jgi:hypothetical protein